MCFGIPISERNDYAGAEHNEAATSDYVQGRNDNVFIKKEEKAQRKEEKNKTKRKQKEIQHRAAAGGGGRGTQEDQTLRETRRLNENAN